MKSSNMFEISGPEVETSKDALLLWEKNELQFCCALEQHIREKYINLNLGEEELGNELKETLEREKYFFVQTISACENLHGGSAYLLFDIDGTILKVDIEAGKKTTIRPSLTALLEHIRSSNCEDKKIEFGFITTRGKEQVLDQLQDNACLDLIQSFINREFVFSTDDLSSADFSGMDDEARKNYLVEHPLTEKSKIDQETIYNLDDQDWRKLEILRRLHRQNPGLAVMAVDDAKYPAHIRNGVLLRDEGFFV